MILLIHGPCRGFYQVRDRLCHGAQPGRPGIPGQRLVDEEKQKPQQERSDMGLIEKLEFCAHNKIRTHQLYGSYQHIARLANYKKKKFQYDVKWGIDMQSEHERYLVEKHFKKTGDRNRLS